MSEYCQICQPQCDRAAGRGAKGAFSGAGGRCQDGFGCWTLGLLEDVI